MRLIEGFDPDFNSLEFEGIKKDPLFFNFEGAWENEFPEGSGNIFWIIIKDFLYKNEYLALAGGKE